MTQNFPYSPPNAPSTYDVLTALSTILTAIIGPVQINDAPALKTAQVGGIKNFTSNLPVCSVTFKSGPSTRRDFGGVVENEIHALLTCFGSYVNAAQAEEWIARLYDLITTYFAENTTLADAIPQGSPIDDSMYPFGVVDVRLLPQSPITGFLTGNNAIPLRVLEMEVIALQRFVTPNGVKRWPPMP